MKKKYLLLLVALLVLLGGIIYKTTYHRQVTTKSTDLGKKSINHDRMHYLTTETIMTREKVSKTEVWFDRVNNNHRLEMYSSDGTLLSVDITVQTKKGVETYIFDFDPKTKTGKFHLLPLNSQSIVFGDLFKKYPSGEYFDEMLKNEKEDSVNPPMIEETVIDGKSFYEITSFFTISQTQTTPAVILLDKETHLPYQTMTQPDGETSTNVTTYRYIWDNFSDTVFTPQPPKGYTLTN